MQSVLTATRKPDDRIMVLAPVVRGRKGEYRKELENYAQAGLRPRAHRRRPVNPRRSLPLDRRKNHTIEIVVDRLLVKNGIAQRLEQSIETALKLTGGLVTIAVVGGDEHVYSEKLACPDCGISVPQLEPRSFSFNSPYGACPECHGLGSKYDFDPAKVIVDWTQAALRRRPGSGFRLRFSAAHAATGRRGARLRSRHAVRKISRKMQNLILYGNPADGKNAKEHLELLRASGASGIESRRIEFRHLPRMAHAIHVARSLRRLQRAPPAP